MGKIVYLVVETNLDTGRDSNVGIFSTVKKCENLIVNTGKSGDFFEYGIIKFIVDNWD